MKQANCPTCGALVTFRSAASILAVCEYCRSTLLRHDLKLENLGRMAELLDDPSPIQIGTEGRFHGIHFAVIGRIQLQYPQGVWNEWHLLFDNQKSGWLGEASGEYTVTFLAAPGDALPTVRELHPGDTLELAQDYFTVADIETGRCIAGQGELPFKVGAGYDVTSADLRAGSRFATIDYSETPPLLFVGESVAFDALHLTNLRDTTLAAPNAQAKALQCPACAGVIAPPVPGVMRIACSSCRALLDAEHPELKLLERYKESYKYDPVIPLGSEGTLRGIPFRVIGYLHRRCISVTPGYSWSEYLLHHPTKGFHWLVEYHGHWNLAAPLTSLPMTDSDMQGTPRAIHDGEYYRHFESSRAEIDCVVGEFYWRVAKGDKAKLDDYVASTVMLSRETTGNEISWSRAEYLTADEVREAFGVKRPMPSTRGVHSNQPNPHQATYDAVSRSFWWAAAAALAIQLIVVNTAQDRTVLSADITLPPGIGPNEAATHEFTLEGNGNVLLRNQTGVNNNWAYLSMELLNRDTGQVWQVNREVSYYSGYDSDGSWSEGSGNDEAILGDVPAGRYLLTVDSETGDGGATGDRIEVRRDVPSWLNWFVAEGLLLLFPLWAWFRHRTFEIERWSDSAHPLESSLEKLNELLEDA